MKPDVTTSVTEEVRLLLAQESFERWRKGQHLLSDGLVVVNNSFVFRDVNTNKADEYLALRVGANGQLTLPPLIASGLRLNLDFKYLSPSSSLPATRSLDAAVADGTANLGELLFILIAEIDDDRVLSQTINHRDFDEVVWKPSLSQNVRVAARRMEVRQVHDEDSVWKDVCEHYNTSHLPVPDGLREAVGIALDKLQENAIADLTIPTVGQVPGNGITDRIVAVLKEQMIQYDEALQHLAAAPTDAQAHNEILRLAYNFAGDATAYLRLIVSVCDLKPLVLWGTASHHLALSEAFRDLPWTRSRNKPSMKNYVESISDSRNSAFHNLFPFRKSLSVHLTNQALGEPQLVIFSEHGRKKDNVLSIPRQTSGRRIDRIHKGTRAVPYKSLLATESEGNAANRGIV